METSVSATQTENEVSKNYLLSHRIAEPLCHDEKTLLKRQQITRQQTIFKNTNRTQQPQKRYVYLIFKSASLKSFAQRKQRVIAIH